MAGPGDRWTGVGYRAVATVDHDDETDEELVTQHSDSEESVNRSVAGWDLFLCSSYFNQYQTKTQMYLTKN